jgi:integrase
VKRTPSYAGVIAVAAFTGARVREVLGLRWQDIDPAAGLISFRLQINVAGAALVPLKTEAAQRTNAIIPSLEPFLGREARMKARWSADDDFVFSVSRGKPRECRNVRRAIGVAAAEAKLGHVRCHDLRHSATSVLLRHADLATVSRYVEHQSPATTLRVYTHALGSQEEQAARIAAAAKSAGFGQ